MRWDLKVLREFERAQCPVAFAPASLEKGRWVVRMYSVVPRAGSGSLELWLKYLDGRRGDCWFVLVSLLPRLDRF